MKRNRPKRHDHRQYQRPTSKHRAGDHRWVTAALVLFAAPVGGCSLLTNLDFVGNGKRPDAGIHADAGATPDAGTTTDAGAHPDAGTPSPDCNPSCISGQICEAGVCVCPDGKVECDGTCIDSLEDAGYCGRCGVACRADQSCGDGGCTCEAGQTDCGTACADIESSPEHCGSCDKRCSTGQRCIHGACKSSPCEGFCTNPEQVQQTNEGFREEKLGSGEHCYDMQGYIPTETNTRIVCWNFDSTRTLTVNGKAVPCVPNHGYDLPSQELGWYCVQVGAGGADDSGILLPNY